MLPETELQRLTPDSPQRSIPARLEYRAEGCDFIHKADGIFVFTEDVLEQLRSTVSHSRLLADNSRSGHRYAKPNNSRHFVERSQMLPRAASPAAYRPGTSALCGSFLATLEEGE